MDDGWAASAQAWMAAQGTAGDFGRVHVLDQPMLARVRASGATTALDVGCGEGRFCRLMAAAGLQTTGLDPTGDLLAAAQARDPDGAYCPGRAELLPFCDGSFDLVVSYLSLIDIPDAGLGLNEMVRVLRPGGRLLIANLSPHATAAAETGWERLADGAARITLRGFLDEQVYWTGWSGIRILNRHRPLGFYIGTLLGSGMQLRHFEEPRAAGCPPEQAARYDQVGYFHLMEWQKPDLGVANAQAALSCRQG